MSEPHRTSMESRPGDTFVALLRYLLRATQTARGTLTVWQAGTITAHCGIGLDGDMPAPDRAAYDTLRIPLNDDNCGEIIIELERPAQHKAFTQLAPGIAELLREQIPQLLEDRRTAVAFELQRGRMASIVDDALEPYIAFDRDGVIREWNAAAAATFGWSRAEAIGRSAADLIVPPQSHDAHRRHFEQLRSSGTHALAGERFTTSALRRDGSSLIVEMRMSVTCVGSGEPIVHAFLHDVTDVEQTRQRLIRSENLLSEAQQIVALGSTDYDAVSGKMFCSDEFFRIVGILKERFDGSRDALEKLIHRDDLAMARAKFNRSLADGEPFDFEHRIVRPDGRTIVVRRRGYALFDEQGTPVRIYTTVQDVTEQRRQDAERLELEVRSAEAFDRAPFGMSMISARPSDFGCFLRVNVAYCALVGYAREDIVGAHLIKIVEPADHAIVHAASRELLSGRSAVVHLEIRIERRDGTMIWVRQTRSLMRDAHGDAQYFFTHSEDITKRKAAERKLEHLAYHDALTRVLNRRGLTFEIKRRFAGSASISHGALLLVDLDHFKYVNDTMGHARGDRILRKVATIVRKTCTDDALIARLGGDEFIVIVPGLTEQQAVTRADEIRHVIRSNVFLSTDSRLRATASIGIVLTDSLSDASIAQALNAADSALLSAKAQGRDRSCVARALVSRHSEMEAELTWSQRIRSALKHDRFELYAQPILNLRSGIVDRYELLLRMIATDGTVILPGDFLPVAERSGLMPEIDCWVVRTSITLAAKMQRAGRPVIFEINLSGASLTNESVTACIENELRSTALDPRALIFEITETAAIGNMNLACSFAQKIREIGCGVALDDFGAGFSSFYYLKYLPFDHLKIDGEFIRNLMTNVSDQHIVRAIVELARGLGKETIAEFVGDADTAILLQQYGVDFAQGYYIGKPAPWDAAPAALVAAAPLFSLAAAP